MNRKMRNSGIYWLGEIPSSWELGKIGELYTERRTKVSDRDYSPLSVTMKGIVPQLTTAAKTDSHDDRKLVCKGDFVINSRSDRRGSCGISPMDGSVSLINIVLQPRTSMSHKYYNWLFHTTMFSDEFYKWGHGIVDDLWTTSWQDMKSISIPIPGLDEQELIAEYVESQCRSVDNAVRETVHSIHEYKQLKQAFITNAVTKGVRGYRKMRESDIAWIGSIPTDWCCSKLKYFATLRSGITLGKKYPYDVNLVEIPYLRVANVQGSYVDLDNVATLSVTPEEVEKYRLRAGEVLMTEGGDRDKLGRGCVWNGELDPCLHQNHVFAVQTNEEKLLGQFLAYITASTVARTYFDVTAKKTTNLACTNSTTILDFAIPIPPIEEQREIVEYLNAKCAEIDALISKKEQLLDELGDFKKSLIYEYVTGKKEVPCASEPVITCIFPAVVPCKSAKFAQAILMSRIIDDFTGAPFGRVKLEKTMHVVENLVGFDFETHYIREAAGPLDHDLYKCEGIISKKNKWFTINSSRHGVSYRPTSIASKYKLYYQKYFSNYDAEITRIIQLFRGYTTDQAEMVATLFASWNDFIIGGKSFTDEDIVDDVLNNWNESKKRFPADSWHRALDEMRKNNIVPRGYGRRTVHQTDVQGS